MPRTRSAWRASSASRSRVSIPDDDDIADPDNSAFGPTGVMREIVAYAPVEPDGSVRMKVPANIAFQLSLLDANGRRVDAAHRAWLSVRPGEVLECNGCHTRTAAEPRRLARPQGLVQLRLCRRRRHRRRVPRHRQHDFARGRRHDGAGARRAMARRASIRTTIGRALRTRCRSTPSAERGLQRDLEAGRDADRLVRVQPIKHLNDARRRPARAASRCGPRPAASPFTTPPSARVPGTSTRCGPCRVRPRGVDDGTGNITFPDTCTNCHSRVDPVDPAVVQLPAASLELTDEVSDEDALQLRAYRQLLFARTELELVNGAIQVRDSCRVRRTTTATPRRSR